MWIVFKSISFAIPFLLIIKCRHIMHSGVNSKFVEIRSETNSLNLATGGLSQTAKKKDNLDTFQCSQ